MRVALGLILVSLPATTAARPVTLGAQIGSIQSAIDADADANRAVGLFGRIELAPRISGQLELSKISSDGTTTLRTGSALIVVDLTRGALVPMLFGGIGIDRSNGDESITGAHAEGGLGLEYRASGGLTIGADLRIGAREMPQPVSYLAVEDAARTAPSQLSSGEYRAARVTLGIRF